ncbi:MAG: hypothetical protein NT027_10575 [Proteobacteria bacterium]|nr:hypothetical protein [Pseudomonadota bacterium]
MKYFFKNIVLRIGSSRTGAGIIFVSLLITAQTAKGEFRTAAEYSFGTPVTESESDYAPTKVSHFGLISSYCVRAAYMCSGIGYRQGTFSGTYKVSVETADEEVDAKAAHTITQRQFLGALEFYPLFFARKKSLLLLNPYISATAAYTSYTSKLAKLNSESLDSLSVAKNGTATNFEYGLGFELGVTESLSMSAGFISAKPKYKIVDQDVSLLTQSILLSMAWTTK